MFLEKLTLKGYRNYAEADVTFSEQINVFLGENAQGKTNIMESIYVLAMTRSHRTANDRELIGWDQDFARVAGSVQKSGGSYPLEIILSKKGKRAKLNHLEQKKLSRYIGSLNIILFAPEDLNLVKGSPSVRRKFLDMEMGQMNTIYLYHLVEYQKILKQRNAYLKQNRRSGKLDETYLSILNEQLAAEGAELLAQRFSFIRRLESWAQPIHFDISQGKETLTLDYASSFSVTSQEDKKQLMQDLLNQYEKHRQREYEQGTTLYGPHRDDIKFYVNDRNVQTYGSQGQQRTTALSLKLAEIDLMHEMTGEYPVLLLDDVLSELDDERQTHLLKTIQDKVQTFLTTTSLDGIKKELLHHPRIFNVRSGQIEMESE